MADGQATADKVTAQQLGTDPAKKPASAAPGTAFPVEDTEAKRIALQNRVKQAEKDLADAAAAAKQAAEPKITDFAGFPGGPFVISGENLKGTKAQDGVKLAGRTVQVTAVRESTIKGTVPADLKPGPIVVEAGSASFSGKLSA